MSCAEVVTFDVSDRSRVVNAASHRLEYYRRVWDALQPIGPFRWVYWTGSG